MDDKCCRNADCSALLLAPIYVKVANEDRHRRIIAAGGRRCRHDFARTGRLNQSVTLSRRWCRRAARHHSFSSAANGDACLRFKITLTVIATVTRRPRLSGRFHFGIAPPTIFGKAGISPRRRAGMVIVARRISSNTIMLAFVLTITGDTLLISCRGGLP